MPSPQLENGYTRIANELYDAINVSDFTKRQAKLVHVIIRHTYGFGRKEWTTTYAAIGRLTGMDRHNARKASMELQLNSVTGVSATPDGWVTVCLNKDYGAWGMLARGQINPMGAGSKRLSAGSDQPPKKDTTTKVTTTTKAKAKRARKALDPLPGFDEFWALYGKRVSKSDARKAWDRKVTTPELRETIMAALTQQIEWRAKAKECDVWFSYWPNGSTWINGEHWANEKPPELDQAQSKLHQLSPELEAANNRHEDWRDPLDTGGVFDHDDVPF